MTDRYDLGTAPPARRALAERLPDAPARVGRPLADELTGIHSARLGRDWRVPYEVDKAAHLVIVLDIAHRSAAYRPR